MPYAGAGPAIFRAWATSLPQDVTLVPVQLPGHGGRFREPALTRLLPMVSALAEVFPEDPRVPFVLYGHSMGALVAFELARELRRRRRTLPRRLVLSGRRAPQVPDPESALHPLPDDELVREVRARFGGIPDEVASEPELMALLLPVLRADLEVVETYPHEAEPPLECPISVFAGAQDSRANGERIDGWRAHTTAAFRSETLPGGHFFAFEDSREAFLARLSEEVRAALAQPAERV